MAELSCLPIAQCSEGNDLAEVEENDSNDTPVCDDDAHKLFCMLAVSFSVQSRS